MLKEFNSTLDTKKEGLINLEIQTTEIIYGDLKGNGPQKEWLY